MYGYSDPRSLFGLFSPNLHGTRAVLLQYQTPSIQLRINKDFYIYYYEALFNAIAIL